MNRLILILCLAASGCAEPEFNPRPTRSEADVLTGTTQLTADFDRATEAYFSRDLNWMIFQGTPRGDQAVEMFIAPFHRPAMVTIGKPNRISPANSQNTCGFFSPDGNSLLFATSPTHAPQMPAVASEADQQKYPPTLEIVRADHWPSAAAGAQPGEPLSLSLNLITHNNAYDAEASYSPDGKWIVFTSFRTGDGDVYVMRPDGSHVVQITKAPGLDGDAFFSPDGTRLVYRSDRMRNGLFQIYVGTLAFDAAGNITGLATERQITHDAGINRQPFWHPDGQHLVYSTARLGVTNQELYLMRDDGSHKTRLTFSAGFDGLAAFSSDGNRLMWTSTRASERTPQIFIARFQMPPGN